MMSAIIPKRSVRLRTALWVCSVTMGGIVAVAGCGSRQKVVRIAVENACSIAGLILTTECVIADKPKEKKDEDKKKSSNYSGSIE